MEENSHIGKIMSLFDTKQDGFKAMGALGNISLQKVNLNYQTLADYSRSLNKEIKQQNFVGQNRLANDPAGFFTASSKM